MKKNKAINVTDISKMHNFVICAYKNSKYLEECIKSVLGQTITSNYLIVTSTPSKFIELLCKKI